jgi:hypothetical protein
MVWGPSGAESSHATTPCQSLGSGSSGTVPRFSRSPAGETIHSFPRLSVRASPGGKKIQTLGSQTKDRFGHTTSVISIKISFKRSPPEHEMSPTRTYHAPNDRRLLFVRLYDVLYYLTYFWGHLPHVVEP